MSRELSLYDSGVAYNLSITYRNASQPSIFERSAPSSIELIDMSAKFITSFRSETSRNLAFQTGYDYQGSLLIPVRSFEFNASWGTYKPVDKNGWWDTDWVTRQGWSSLLGLELSAGYTQSGWGGAAGKDMCFNFNQKTTRVIGTATIATSYIQPNCSYAQLKDISLFPGTLPFVDTVFNLTNATSPTMQISERWNNNSTLVSTCLLTETRVEMKISCSAQGCVSVQEKATPGQQLSISLFNNLTASNIFLSSLILTGGAPTSNDSRHTAIVDDHLGLGHYALFYDWKTQYRIPPEPGLLDYRHSQAAAGTSETLSRLLNAYLAISQEALMNTMDAHILNVLDGTLADPGYVLGYMKSAPYQPQYRLNWVWMVLDYIGCIVLLVAASFAVWLRKRILTPDIFGYVSSLTRDNPMIDLPAGGSTLNGLDRARMMKGVKVKIADVGAGDGLGLGRVGLTMKNSSSDNVAELKKGKQYM